MKNESKHEGLPNSETRDFLAKHVRFSYIGEVDQLESQIEHLKEKLKVAKAHSAASGLIELNGWIDHDVSDDVDFYDSGTYFSFIGTDEELKAALSKGEK